MIEYILIFVWDFYIIVNEKSFQRGDAKTYEACNSKANMVHGECSLIPFLLSILLGNPTIYHIPLFLAWLFIYLATYPFLMYMKQRRKKEFLYAALLYFMIAGIFGIISLLYEWKIVMFIGILIPLFYSEYIFCSSKKGTRINK